MCKRSASLPPPESANGEFCAPAPGAHPATASVTECGMRATSSTGENFPQLTSALPCRYNLHTHDRLLQCHRCFFGERARRYAMRWPEPACESQLSYRRGPRTTSALAPRVRSIRAVRFRTLRFSSAPPRLRVELRDARWSGESNLAPIPDTISAWCADLSARRQSTSDPALVSSYPLTVGA